MRRGIAPHYYLLLSILSSLAGCATTSISPVTGTIINGRLSVDAPLKDPLPDITFDVPSKLSRDVLPPVLTARVSSEEFIAVYYADDNEVIIEKHGKSLNTVWRSVIDIGDDEYIETVYTQGDKAVLLSTQFNNRVDSVSAVARVYELATGRAQGMRILDTKPGNSEWISKDGIGRYGEYKVDFSPDSSLFVLINRYEDKSDSQQKEPFHYYIHVIDHDLKSVCNGNIASNIWLPRIWVSNSGSVFAINHINDQEMSLSRYDFVHGSTTIWNYIHTQEQEAGMKPVRPQYPVIHIQSDSSVVIAMGTYYRARNLRKLIAVRFDMGNNHPTTIVNELLPTTSDDVLSNFWMSDDGSSVFSFQKLTYNETVMSYTSYDGSSQSGGSNIWYNSGTVRFFAFQNKGELLWRSGFDRYQQVLEQLGPYGLQYHVAPEGSAMQRFIYHDHTEGGLMLTTLNIGTGVLSPKTQVLGLGDAAVFMQRSTIWLNDTTIIAPIKKNRDNAEIISLGITEMGSSD
jgi:hypothetical protein